jgi:hypothetical protein
MPLHPSFMPIHNSIDPDHAISPGMESFWSLYRKDLESAGISEVEVARMSSDDRQSLLAMLRQSSGQSMPHPPIQLPRPSHTLLLNKSTFISLSPYDESRRAEGVHDYAALQALWRSIVEDLAVYPAHDRIRYSQQIQPALTTLAPELSTGIMIGALLPCGARITRTFGEDLPASQVYIWCAGDDKMIQDLAKPGMFVMLKKDGIALRPNETLKNQIHESRVLLHVRMIG